MDCRSQKRVHARVRRSPCAETDRTTRTDPAHGAPPVKSAEGQNVRLWHLVERNERDTGARCLTISYLAVPKLISHVFSMLLFSARASR